MNNARLARVEANQTATAKKVLECVPISQPWSKHQIVSEVLRGGTRLDPHMIAGCLGSLTDDGLIKEPMRGHYQRIRIEPKEPLKVVKPEPHPDSGPEPDILDQFIDIAARMRSIADDIEKLGLKVETSKHDNDEELTKLRQLKNLLKGL